MYSSCGFLGFGATRASDADVQARCTARCGPGTQLQDGACVLSDAEARYVRTMETMQLLQNPQQLVKHDLCESVGGTISTVDESAFFQEIGKPTKYIKVKKCDLDPPTEEDVAFMASEMCTRNADPDTCESHFSVEVETPTAPSDLYTSCGLFGVGVTKATDADVRARCTTRCGSGTQLKGGVCVPSDAETRYTKMLESLTIRDLGGDWTGRENLCDAFGGTTETNQKYTRCVFPPLSGEQVYPFRYELCVRRAGSEACASFIEEMRSKWPGVRALQA